jgi:hypothetical protein
MLFGSKFVLSCFFPSSFAILGHGSGIGGQGDTRRTCGTTVAAGKAKAVKAAKVYACMSRLVTCPRNLQKQIYVHTPVTNIISLLLQLFSWWCIGATSSVYLGMSTATPSFSFTFI